MVPSPLPPAAVSQIRSIIDAACSDPVSDLPFASASIVGDGKQRDGRLLDYNTAARQDDVYWLASCTKLVTAIACMQLVEKNVLFLDDVEQVCQLCPYLKNVKVLREDGTLVATESGITLRMLLTHTGNWHMQGLRALS